MKKRLFILISIFVLTSLIICSCSVDSDSKTNKVIDRVSPPTQTQPLLSSATTQKPETQDTAKNIISDKELFDIFYENFSNYNKHFVVNGQLDADKVSHIIKELIYSCPEMFWISEGGNLLINKQTEVSTTILNNYNIEQIKTMSETLSKKVDSIIEMIDPKWSDYNKALFVHDYIIDNTSYDYNTATLSNRMTTLSDTVYGCLVNGEAVCGGYSKAFTLIMNALDIKSGVIHGLLDDVPHAWNYIEIEGQYYWLDLTNDDQEVNGEKDKYLRHGYFLFDDDMLFRNYQIDYDLYSEISLPIFIPKCTTLKNNYYNVNNSYYVKYSFDDLNVRTSQQIDNNFIELMFANKTEYQKCMEDLLKKDKYGRTKIFQLDIFKNRNVGLKYAYSDVIYALEFRIF